MNRKLLYLFFLVLVTNMRPGLSQLDSIHVIPPLHSRNEPGEQYLYLSTPSQKPISIRIFTGRIPGIVDCSGNRITIITISNSNPKVLCVGKDYGDPLLVSEARLNRPLTNYGLRLKSSDLFYVNLRIFTNNGFQAGSLTSKGKWAKGKIFRIGHVFSNNDPTGHKCHFVGITATKNATKITINDLAPNLRFAGVSPKRSFFLNRGESYVFSVYLDARVPQNDNGLMGALLRATAPVYVNCGSWTGSPNTQLRDMGIDQITPIKVLGSEYIVVKGFGPSSLETPIVIAHQDNTQIYLNGNQRAYRTLNAGEWVVIPTSLYSAQENMYIRASDKIAVYQMLGVNDDPRTVGLNFIPPLSCLGDSIVDNIVDIHHIGSRLYQSGLFVIAEQGADLWLNNNKYNGTPQPVEGNPDYVTYRITSSLPKDISIRSSGIIQVGMYGFLEPSGFAGYFSGFQTFKAELDVESDFCIDTLRAILHNIDSFEWYRNDTLLVNEKDITLKIKRQGRYRLVGYQCNGLKDSTEEVFIGLPDTVFVESGECGLKRDTIIEKKLTNVFGCDSTVYWTIYALPEDTVRVTTHTCKKEESGVFTEVLSNSYGCDSVVIKTVKWISPKKVFIEETVCDSRDTGTYVFVAKDLNGCDSITVWTFRLGRKDTVELTTYVCPPDSGRIITEKHTNVDGCDSIVIQQLEVAEDYYYEMKEEFCVGESVEIRNVKVEKDTTIRFVYPTRHGCDSVYEYEIVFYPSYEIRIFDTICVGEQIEFEGNIIDKPGQYDKRYVTVNGCDSVIVLYLALYPRPEAEIINPPNYCLGDSIEIKLSKSYSSYLWSDGSRECCVWRDTGGWISVIVANSNGCRDTAELWIQNPINIEVDWHKRDVLCYKDKSGSIEINQVLGGIAPYTYRINNHNIVPPTIDGLPKGRYLIEIEDQTGCKWSDTAIIHGPDTPFTTQIYADTNIVRWGESVEIHLRAKSGTISGNEWYINGDLTYQDRSEVILTPTGKAEIRVRSTDENGCVSWAVIVIDVYYDPKVYIPNVFTPNGDGVNDFFEILPNDHIKKINVLRIFSRWGELLYEREQLLPGSPDLKWDGRFHGNPLNNSVVVYYVEALSINNQTLKFAGDVTIVR